MKRKNSKIVYDLKNEYLKRQIALPLKTILKYRKGSEKMYVVL